GSAGQAAGRGGGEVTLYSLALRSGTSATVRKTRKSSFERVLANRLEGLKDSPASDSSLSKNSPVFNDIRELQMTVWLPTFIDFALTKCEIVRLDSVKGATNGNSPYFQ